MPQDIGLLVTAEFCIVRAEIMATFHSLDITLLDDKPIADDDEGSLGSAKKSKPRNSKGQFAKEPPASDDSTIKATSTYAASSMDSMASLLEGLKALVAEGNARAIRPVVKELLKRSPLSPADYSKATFTGCRTEQSTFLP